MTENNDALGMLDIDGCHLSWRSRYFAMLASKLTLAGDCVTGMLVGLEGLKAIGDDTSIEHEVLDLIRSIADALNAQREIAILDHDSSEVCRAEFSQDNHHIVTVSRNGLGQLWKYSDDTISATLKMQWKLVRYARFLGDRLHVAVTFADGKTKVYSVSNGAEVVVSSDLSADARNGDAMAEKTEVLRQILAQADAESWQRSQDGRRLITISIDGEYCHQADLWDLSSGDHISCLVQDVDITPDFDISLDSSFIVGAYGERVTKIWDAQTGNELFALHGHRAPVETAKLSPDGTMIVTSSRDCTARLWNAKNGQKLATLRGHTGPLAGACFSSDGKLVLTSSIDGTARLWRTKASGELGSFSLPYLNLWDVALSPVRSVLCAAEGIYDKVDDSYPVRIWQPRTGQVLAQLKGHEGEVRTIAFSPDGKTIVTGSTDHTARIWDATTMRILHELRGHESAVKYARFSLDGSQVLTVSWDNTVRIWDSRTGIQTHAITVPARAKRATFSVDGLQIVTVMDHMASIYDLESGGHINDFKNPDANILDAGFATLGPLACVADGRTALLNDMTSHAQIAILEGHEWDVLTATFSPDGNCVATTSGDGTARLWSVKFGAELATFGELDSDIYFVAFSPNSLHIATIASNGMTRIWPVFTTEEQIIKGVRSRAPRVLTDLQRTFYGVPAKPP